MRFPFDQDIQIKKGLTISYKEVNRLVEPYLTGERKAKIKQVVSRRTFNSTIVLESIYDRGNVSAVMRSAEAFGFGGIHVIETGEKFKEANRVTQGADKWLEVQKYKSTRECITKLKNECYQICVTSLEASLPIDEIDFSKPSALVLGNEKDGVSKEMMELADQRILIPMQGFVQSFNISVAGALCSYHMYQDRMRRLGHHGDLTEEQQQILQAHYYLRSLDSAPEKIELLLKREGKI